ncbi:MAG: M28 family peptidase, partial [Bacteroidales bacterium]|nr:M28 family peptidase [Bacteroidales bacterium]
EEPENTISRKVLKVWEDNGEEVQHPDSIVVYLLRNGKVFDKEMSLIQKINDENNYFKHIQIRGEACNSDHCPFYKKNIPSIYIYTKGGTQAYHDINDNADQLPLTKFNELFNLLVKFVKEYK